MSDDEMSVSSVEEDVSDAGSGSAEEFSDDEAPAQKPEKKSQESRQSNHRSEPKSQRKVVSEPIFDPFAVGSKKKKSGGTFQTMGLLPEILNAIKKKGYRQPTPIQRQVIPIVMSGSDVVAMARTGSGKTLAFVLPMVNRLRTHSAKTAGVRALIMSPTRELCTQTYKYTKMLASGTDLRVALLTGGDNIEHHFEQLAANPDVVIATPGRLLHILHETGISLANLEFLIFDEADRLFEMGFQAEIESIVRATPSTRQTLLFSATLPKMLMEFTRAGLRTPEIVRLDAEQQLSEQLALSYFSVRTEEKPAALMLILREIVLAKPNQQAIVFAATKHHVEYLYELLTMNHISCSMIYGRMDNSARKINLAKFKKQKSMVLIVTDVAARGIDLPQLDYVINYDFPFKPKLFVHRVGRTARAGRSGSAISILQPDELAYLLDLQLFLASTKVQPVLNGVPNGVHGRLPSRQLQMYHETILSDHKKHHSLQNAYDSLINAVKLYRETRIPPTPASIKKAKEIVSDAKYNNDGNPTLRLEVHPLFAHMIDDAEEKANAFISKLKEFRPAQSIFEVENKKGKIIGTKSAVKARGADKMKEIKESLTAAVIRKKKQKMMEKSLLEQQAAQEEQAGPSRKRKTDEITSGTSGDSDDDIAEPDAKRPKKEEKAFKDDKYFMKLEPSNTNMDIERGLSINDSKSGNLEEMLFELTPDDDRSIFRKRSIMKWDQRKRKFIREPTEDPSKKKLYIRTESGQQIKADKAQSGKMYKEWMEKTKKRIPTLNEPETGGQQVTPRGATPFKHWSNKKQQTGQAPQKGRKGPKNEVKSVEQIKKSRRDEAKKKEREERFQKIRAKHNARKRRD